ncbi:MAG TPA: GH25 family lysozyme [Arachidicoccus sp.]|nr:GH25 family lysozyme [Arachidicoccus sp.]
MKQKKQFLPVLSQLVSFLLIGLILQPGTLTAQQGRIWGLDISHHQGDIDWDKLADTKPHFFYFKATEGSTHSDANYSQNRKAAGKMGVPSGAYHFFSYTSPGIRQALHFIETAKLKKGDLPPVLDIEWIRPMPSVGNIIREVTTFLSTVEKRTGVRPIIYTDCMLYNQYLKKGLKKEYQRWIASYNSAPECECIFWQKTNNYKIDGVRSGVDYNLFMGTKKAFQELRIP